MIKRAAVVGAGTMGAGIAAQLANAGIECLLLDIIPNGLSEAESKDPAARSRLALEAVERMAKGRPPGFMDPQDRTLVQTGNLEDDIERVSECDWVIEAVTERLDIKRAIYEKINRYRKPDTIVSSNTSGLALNLLTEGFDDNFREHFLITHFFNPPRYMYLLEIVPGVDTRADVLARIETFCELWLGKGIVRCKDTANFIANRIGVYVMGIGAQLMIEEGLNIEEVDAITGPLMGRPKTASFRLQDLVGVDVSVMVMENAKKLLPNDESLARFNPPELLTRLVKEGRLGRKAGAGFYKKVGKEILVLDLETFDYRPPKPVEFASLTAAKKAGAGAAGLKALIEGDDPAARYAWRLLAETLLYSARRVPEIADDIVSVDRAMRWGFNWDLGPFEAWDAIGVPASVERMESDGQEIPALVTTLLDSGNESFYGALEGASGSKRAYFDLQSSLYSAVPSRPGVLLLDEVRRQHAPIRAHSDASIWDLGDGVLGVEFHSKMNSISGETLQTIVAAIDIAEAEDYAGVVVGNQAVNFSVGANLKLVADAAGQKNFGVVEEMLQAFHGTVLRMRYSSKPVVVAVQGLALGGGCEIALGGDRIQAAAETYLGLVELGVGLIPAGGGTRELACRTHEQTPSGVGEVLFPFLSASFETVAKATTSTSAANARTLGFIQQADAISMNRDRALRDAKNRVIQMAEAGYRPPRGRHSVRVAGSAGIAELKILLHQYCSGGFISDYDTKVATKFAYALCGGDIDHQHRVTETYLLDLEREVFLSLLGEAKTQERIAHTLKTGKPLRN
ncbi:MAG: 3-hydroxyacyl-CoA dehydrogenase NAD-binding domain-containing protein [Planctomycetes bacterium]|nr:3-hydroxyacyl-CoA dehydrogenase NAD-binding domain-containing protein [Planctomycetota bacterium]